MADYCSATDVQNEFKQIDFTASGAAMTTAKVSELIDQERATIHAYIMNRYQVPVASSAADAYSLLKKIHIMLLKDRIKGILEVKEARQETNQSAGASTKSEAYQLLEFIRDGKIDLKGATLASSDEGTASYVSSNSVERVFKKDEDQW